MRGRPSVEAALLLALLAERAQTFQPPALALPLFPRVGHRGMLRRVADARIGILGLLLAHDVETHRPQRDLVRVASIQQIVDRIGQNVLLGLPRKPVYERKVALAQSARRNRERATRTERHVIFRVVGRSIVGPRIDAEQRKVARMARPHPVVGIAAELADRRRRSCHETDVGVVAVYEQEILIAVKERLDIGPAVGSPNRRVDHPGRIEPDQRVAARLGQIVPHPVKHLRGHVLHADQKRHVQAGVG